MKVYARESVSYELHVLIVPFSLEPRRIHKKRPPTQSVKTTNEGLDKTWVGL